MGKQTNIAWTHKTWNPHKGCRKVSEECKYCYMYREMDRYKPKDPNLVKPSHDPRIVQRTKSSTFYAPLNWAKNPEKHDAPFGTLIFTCSWSDFFIEEADAWRDEIWDIIRQTPQFTYQILTKRPERIKNCLPKDWGDGWDNVWLGVSVGMQKQLPRVGILNSVPAKLRFVSIEPLLESMSIFSSFGSPFLPDWMVQVYYNRENDLPSPVRNSGIHWVILGGESGNQSGKYHYRPCELEWLNRIVGNCQDINIPVFVKQLGTHLQKELGLKARHGTDINEFPESLQLQQFPCRLLTGKEDYAEEWLKRLNRYDTIESSPLDNRKMAAYVGFKNGKRKIIDAGYHLQNRAAARLKTGEIESFGVFPIYNLMNTLSLYKELREKSSGAQ